VNDVTNLFDCYPWVLQDLLVRQPQHEVAADDQLVITMPISPIVASHEVAPTVHFDNHSTIEPHEVHEMRRGADRVDTPVEVKQAAELRVGRQPFGENAFPGAPRMRATEDRPDCRRRAIRVRRIRRVGTGFEVARPVRDGVEGVLRTRLSGRTATRRAPASLANQAAALANARRREARGGGGLVSPVFG
jgi:hypothetical protein